MLCLRTTPQYLLAAGEFDCRVRRSAQEKGKIKKKIVSYQIARTFIDYFNNLKPKIQELQNFARGSKRIFFRLLAAVAAAVAMAYLSISPCHLFISLFSFHFKNSVCCTSLGATARKLLATILRLPSAPTSDCSICCTVGRYPFERIIPSILAEWGDATMGSVTATGLHSL